MTASSKKTSQEASKASTEPEVTKQITTVAEALLAASPRPAMTAQRDEKKNYAQRFSQALAILMANRLREQFPGITPDKLGRRQEARARTAKGYKRLDVNYSTPELGLGLGVSVKTLNFRDAASGRYTKNYTRIDNELRAEASDYHERQPYAVLVAVIFLPVDSCDDAKGKTHSSFAQAVTVFRRRDERRQPTDAAQKLERLFIGLYDPKNGETLFWDVVEDPPEEGRPTQEQCLGLDDLIEQIISTFDERNK